MTMPQKPRIAIQNLHNLPNLTSWKLHNYVLELLQRGHVQYLYFDENSWFKNARQKISVLNHVRQRYGYAGLGLDKARFLFTRRSLERNVDILLNFNASLENELTPSVKAFQGMKVFHLMDYFWREPGSVQHKRLVDHGVHYVMNYGSPNKYCAYFQYAFPTYMERVLPVPFGYTERFKESVPIGDRTRKCIALGSVNPLRPEDVSPLNYAESAAFYRSETWFHKFRRMVVEHEKELDHELDSMLPVYPKYKDGSYDIVQKLNTYQLFVSCESLFYFPPAKLYEGGATGAVPVCSDHPCFQEYGFFHGKNCVVHKQFDLADLKHKVLAALEDQRGLSEIASRSKAFVTEHYSHQAIADNLAAILGHVFEVYFSNGNYDLPRELVTWPKLHAKKQTPSV